MSTSLAHLLHSTDWIHVSPLGHLPCWFSSQSLGHGSRGLLGLLRTELLPAWAEFTSSQIYYSSHRFLVSAFPSNCHRPVPSSTAWSGHVAFATGITFHFPRASFLFPLFSFDYLFSLPQGLTVLLLLVFLTGVQPGQGRLWFSCPGPHRSLSCLLWDPRALGFLTGDLLGVMAGEGKPGSYRSQGKWGQESMHDYPEPGALLRFDKESGSEVLFPHSWFDTARCL